MPPSDALCTALQVLNHLQDCAKDLLAPRPLLSAADMLARFGARASTTCAARPRRPACAAVFDALLDQRGRAEPAGASTCRAARATGGCGWRRAVIVGLARRLARRLRRGDPVAAAGEADEGRRRRRGRSPACGSCRDDRSSTPRRPTSPRSSAIVRAAGTSFYRGMRVLPPRPAATRCTPIYAFCRMVDDIADEAGADRRKLAAARPPGAPRVAALYRGEADGRGDARAAAGGAALRAAAGGFPRGHRRHADGRGGAPIVAPDLATLDLYCDRVAAAVGRLSVRAFGDASADAPTAWPTRSAARCS